MAGFGAGIFASVEAGTVRMATPCVVVWSRCWRKRNASGFRGFEQRARLASRYLSSEGKRVGVCGSMESTGDSASVAHCSFFGGWSGAKSGCLELHSRIISGWCRGCTVAFSGTLR
jgi:hypothetical protein